MVDRGLDYSWGRPHIPTVVAEGYRFVCRYVSYDKTGKNLTADELAALRAAGLEVALNWQWAGNWTELSGGAARGAEHGREAVRRARDLGYPTGCTIYYSVDFDPLPDQLPTVLAYMNAAGAETRAAGYRMGVYGGYRTVAYLMDRGAVDDAWQTYAWSGGRWDGRAALRQVRNGARVGGADVDINERHGRTYMMGGSRVVRVPAKTLPHLTHVQDTGYYCGPASVVTALSARGISIDESTAARLLGTTTFGTNSSNDVVRGLNHYVGAGVYAAAFVPSGGGASAFAAFRDRLVSSISAGYVVVANVVGSARDSDGRTYNYPGGHYVAVVGYRSDGDEALVTDVAVGRDYWISTRALIDWIAGRGYAYAQGVDDGVSPQEFADIVTTILIGATEAGYWDPAKVSNPHLKNMAAHATFRSVAAVEGRLSERMDALEAKLDALSTGGVDTRAIADAIKADLIASLRAEVRDVVADAHEAAANAARKGE